MKNTLTKLTALAVVILMMLALVACNVNTVDPVGAWENATHLSDKTFGSGKTTIEVEIKVGEQSVTFTVKTDAENLEDALVEHNIIAGEQSTYGLMVDTVNGIRADYTLDGAWWQFCKNGSPLNTGASSELIEDGAHYEILYTPA